MSNPLSDLIQRGESGSTSYNAYNRGTQGGKILGQDHSIDFSKLTVGQIQGMQDKGEIFAVGKYQVIPSTMNGAVASLNLDPNQAFTPELQEKIFSDYLIGDQRPAIRDYITGKSSDLDGAQLAVAQQWRSVADPRTGESYISPHHKGPNPNHASITANEVAGALNTMRAEYQADIAKGMKPDEAWSDVTHSTASREKAASTHATHSHATETLKQGAHGPAMHALQADLARLGYTDHRGRLLAADGVFGIDTRHAVERFQHDHHLTVDGKVGPLTQQALHTALQQHTTAHDLVDPKNPDHALFEQALTKVRGLEASGHPTGQQQRNLAAALVAEAKREGFTRIDQVALGDDGRRAYIAQNATSPIEQAKFGSVNTVAALQTPMTQSTAAAAALSSPAVAPSAPIVHAPATSQTLAI